MILEQKKVSKDKLLKFLKTFDKNVKVLNNSQRKDLLSEINDEIKTNKLTKTDDKNRRNIWNKSWSMPAKFSKYYVPQYIKDQKYFRICGHFVYSQTPYFEAKISRQILLYIFKKYVKKKHNICEFGAGSGKNIIFLKKANLVKDLFASDWVSSAVSLIKKNCNQNFLKVKSFKFDMKKPLNNIDFVSKTLVMTHHSMEQIYDKFKNFINILIKKKPILVVHLEPIIENYDPKDPIDRTAIKYHNKRKYLKNLKTHLYNLEAKKVIKILHDQRFYFGTKFHEGYSLIIWEVNNNILLKK